MVTSLLVAPVVAVVVVVAGYVYLTSRNGVASGHLPAPPQQPTAATTASPAAPLGPWKHIATRAGDPVPLTVSELFPAQFSQAGESGTRTAEQPSTKCTRWVIGSALRAAVHSAGCTQVLRASYLSGDKKMMGTIGVLNLVSATAAQRAGRASGSSGFISQLPGAHGPTRSLTRGTGLEEAEVKGHYLILVWAEFTSLHRPSGAHQRAALVAFETGLINGTANVSLSRRMVTGQP